MAVVAIAAIGGFLFGYDTGVISGALLLLEEDFGLDDFEKEVVVSIALFGAIIGSFIGGPAADQWGRRPLIASASALFLVGSLLMGLTPSATQSMLWWLLVGRFVVGLGIGLAANVVPVYLSEISPMRFRGALITLNILCITVGQFVSYIGDAALAEVHEGWRWMLGLAAVPALLQLIGMLFFVTESPRWLLTKETATGEAKARDILLRLNPKASQAELNRDIEEIKANVREEQQQDAPFLPLFVGDGEADKEHLEEEENNVSSSPSPSSIRKKRYQRVVDDESMRLKKKSELRFARWRRLFHPALRPALLVGLSLQAIQQFAGINTAMYYSATIIKMSGRDDQDAIRFATFVALSNALFSVVSLLLIDRVGRRKLLFLSMMGTILGLLLLGGSFLLSSSSSSTLSGNLAIASLTLYVAFFAIGLGPIPWTVNAEIYPPSVRGLANGLATTVNWATNLIMSMTFLSFVDLVGEAVTFWTYAGVTTMGLVFMYLKLPETRGKSLEQIQAEL
ncbi:Inositol transporter 1 [Balamuthia mandrillaris]